MDAIRQQLMTLFVVKGSHNSYYNPNAIPMNMTSNAASHFHHSNSWMAGISGIAYTMIVMFLAEHLIKHAPDIFNRLEKWVSACFKKNAPSSLSTIADSVRIKSSIMLSRIWNTKDNLNLEYPYADAAIDCISRMNQARSVVLSSIS